MNNISISVCLCIAIGGLIGSIASCMFLNYKFKNKKRKKRWYDD